MEITKHTNPTPQQSFRGAARACANEIRIVIESLQTAVATLGRIQEIDLPPQVATQAEKDLRTVASALYNGLTGGRNAIVRTLPAQMLELERSLIRLAET